MFQLPPALTYNLDAYGAVATDTLIVATAGATLALVLLGLRTLFGAMIGHDHVNTHVTGRIIPATALAMAYPVLVAQFVGLVNLAGASVGPQALAGLLAFAPAPNPQLILPYLALWLLVIVYAVRLLISLAYSLFRFLVALVFAGAEARRAVVEAGARGGDTARRPALDEPLRRTFGASAG